MAKPYKDVEYTKVQLDSPVKEPVFGEGLHEPDGTDHFHDGPGDDREELIEDSEKVKGPSFWQFQYYQEFFDVETGQVLRRLVGSMVPHPRINFLRQTLRPKADLYGPFWVCTTLIFAIAIAGNLANYLQHQGKSNGWRYDFRKVTFAATAIYSYWWIVPIVIWGLLRWRGSRAGYTFVEILAVYGYSLTIYIPISFLWTIQINWLQWLLVMLAMTLSGAVLILTFWPAVRDDKKQFALIVMVIIVVLHCALALGFMLYFFHVPSYSARAPKSIATLAPKIVTNTSTVKMVKGKAV